jgi:hypothetical protein
VTKASGAVDGDDDVAGTGRGDAGSDVGCGGGSAVAVDDAESVGEAGAERERTGAEGAVMVGAFEALGSATPDDEEERISRRVDAAGRTWASGGKAAAALPGLLVGDLVAASSIRAVRRLGPFLRGRGTTRLSSVVRTRRTVTAAATSPPSLTSLAGDSAAATSAAAEPSASVMSDTALTGGTAGATSSTGVDTFCSSTCTICGSIGTAAASVVGCCTSAAGSDAGSSDVAAGVTSGVSAAGFMLHSWPAAACSDGVWSSSAFWSTAGEVDCAAAAASTAALVGSSCWAATAAGSSSAATGTVSVTAAGGVTSTGAAAWSLAGSGVGSG